MSPDALALAFRSFRLPTMAAIWEPSVERAEGENWGYRRLLPSLLEGGFVDRAENILAFGLPGRGKSHLVFSKWDQIFKDPMTTMAAIDRLVHHAIIREFTGESIREQKAKAKDKGGQDEPPK